MKIRIYERHFFKIPSPKMGSLIKFKILFLTEFLKELKDMF